jgi:hypothetical protein
MGFDEYGQAIPIGCSEDRLDQMGDLIIVFQAPTGVDRDAEVAARGVFRGDSVSFGRRVDPVEAAVKERRARDRRVVGGKLDTLESIGKQALVAR